MHIYVYTCMSAPVYLDNVHVDVHVHVYVLNADTYNVQCTCTCTVYTLYIIYMSALHVCFSLRVSLYGRDGS